MGRPRLLQKHRLRGPRLRRQVGPDPAAAQGTATPHPARPRLLALPLHQSLVQRQRPQDFRRPQPLPHKVPRRPVQAPAPRAEPAAGPSPIKRPRLARPTSPLRKTHPLSRHTVRADILTDPSRANSTTFNRLTRNHANSRLTYTRYTQTIQEHYIHYEIHSFRPPSTPTPSQKPTRHNLKPNTRLAPKPLCQTNPRPTALHRLRLSPHTRSQSHGRAARTHNIIPSYNTTPNTTTHRTRHLSKVPASQLTKTKKRKRFH